MTVKVAPGRVVHRRRDPLPPFDSTLFGPFGCLTDAVVKRIHVDEVWHGDGVPYWKGAPTSVDAVNKAAAVVARLRHKKFESVVGAIALAAHIDKCRPGSRCGSHACPLCARADQRWLVHAITKLIKKRGAGYHDFTFNLVMPDGQTPIQKLRSAPFQPILGKCVKALGDCKDVNFSVLGIDISANDDSEKFRLHKLTGGSETYFQVHVYGIVRARNRDAIWATLRPLFPRAQNIYRPLHLSKGFNGSLKGISYLCKPDGFRHVAYFDRSRHEWNTLRKSPALRPGEHVQYLLAMDELGFAGRIALVGLHPEISPASGKRSREVSLRHVHRSGSSQPQQYNVSSPQLETYATTLTTLENPS